MTNGLPVGFATLGTPVDIERAFLATMLNRPTLIARYQHLHPSMIYDPGIASLWSITIKTDHNGLLARGSIVGAMLNNNGALARALTSDATTAFEAVQNIECYSVEEDHLETLVAVIIDRWQKREAKKVADDLVNGLGDSESGEMAGELFQRCVERLTKLQGSIGVTKARSVKDVCDSIIKSGAMFDKISTGYPRLDEAMGGKGLIAPGVTVFEARPKCFKTGTMISIAYKLAQRDERSAFVTLEMPSEQILARMAAAENIGNVRNFDDYPDRQRRAVEFFSQKFPDQIMFYDMPGASFASIQSTLWSIASMGIRVVFLDYFQLIRGCPPDQSMLDFREDMAGWMQAFANKTRTALVIAAQVGRSGETYGSDALNRNASFVGQIQLAQEHSKQARERRFWMDIRFIRHGEAAIMGADDDGPMTISDVGPMLKIEEKLP